MDISENPAVTVQPRARHRIIFAAAVCVVLAFTLAFLGVGRWLVVEDNVEKADAIAVLSGRMPLRALEASRLFRQGYAPQVWLTYSREPGETLEAMGIRFEGEEHYNTRILIHEGVPADAIHILEPPILDTVDEIKAISAALERKKGGSVILVTSKVHTRRTRLLWQKLVPDKSRAIVRAASEDPFDPAHWWRNTGDALDVVREVLGLMNAWAGLPLMPAR